MPCAHTVQSNYLNSMPPDINYLIKCITCLVHTSLDTVAPLKRKDVTEMCNLHLAWRYFEILCYSIKKLPVKLEHLTVHHWLKKKIIATLDFSSAQYSFQYHWSLFRLFFSNLSNYYFSNSKTSTCVLDHIPTRLLNEVLPSYNLSLLNMPISINDLGTTDFQASSD